VGNILLRLASRCGLDYDRRPLRAADDRASTNVVLYLAPLLLLAMAEGGDASDFDASRAELFEALGHPIRIKILHALQDGPLGFADLRRRVGIDSGGHLQFHLGKLDGLIRSRADGNYELTQDGADAMRIVVSAQAQGSQGPRREGHGHRVSLSRAVLAALIAAMVLVASVAVVQQSEIGSQQRQIQDLLAQIARLNETAVSSPSSLQLLLSLNATTIGPNQVIQITAWEFNPLDRLNNVSAAEDWPSPFEEEPACGWGVEVVQVTTFQGYYIAENISMATSTGTNGSTICICLLTPFYPSSPSYFVFQPSSSVATLNSGQQVSVGASETAIDTGSSLAIVGAITTFTILPNGTVFSPGPELGVYTAAAYDMWGHLTLEYFTVTS